MFWQTVMSSPPKFGGAAIAKCQGPNNYRLENGCRKWLLRNKPGLGSCCYPSRRVLTQMLSISYRPCIHTVNFFTSPSIPLPLPFPQRPQVEKDADHRTLHVHYPVRTTYE
jgi:hypothetical protein